MPPHSSYFFTRGPISPTEKSIKSREKKLNNLQKQQQTEKDQTKNTTLLHLRKTNQ